VTTHSHNAPPAARTLAVAHEAEPPREAEPTPAGPDTDPLAELAGLPLLLPVPRAAVLLGISRAAAYRLTASGELPSRRLGGRVYVITTALRTLVEAA
jgi:excisionase family DNA binding protein